MSITKATAETVKAAWESLLREGKHADPQSIQKVTGGSLSTVYKLYRQLRLEEAEREIRRREDDNEDYLHSVAAELVEQLYSHCKARADKVALVTLQELGTSAREVLSIEGGARAHEERRQAELVGIEARKAELGARARELEALRERLEAENRALVAENGRLSLEVEMLRGRLGAQAGGS